jgi:hypothetical protein
LDQSPDSSFITRNYFKCAQGLADATLIALNHYCSDPAIKSQRLEELALSHSIVSELHLSDHLDRAKEFRRNPHAGYVITSDDLRALSSDWCRLFLWCESNRLNRRFHSISDYLKWTGRREPCSGSRFKAIAAQVRRGRLGWHHPRESVYRSLPIALQQLSAADPRFDLSSHQAICEWREAQ